MNGRFIERRIGHWLTVTDLGSEERVTDLGDARVHHECLLCGFRIESGRIDVDAPDWLRDHNANIRRVREVIAQHDRPAHPEEVAAQQMAEFRHHLHAACNMRHGLAAYQWPDTAVRWKAVLA